MKKEMIKKLKAKKTDDPKLKDSIKKKLNALKGGKTINK